MPIKLYKPVTPALRHTSVVDTSALSKVRPPRFLRITRKQRAGRNMSGRITVRHRGGGEKRFIRLVDFRRDKYDIPGRVETVEYDPNRNAYIALISYRDGERRYILAPNGLAVGATVVSSHKPVEVQAGNQTVLKNIPTGSEVHNIEMIPGKGGQLCRAAGSYAVLTSVDGGRALLKLPSGEVRVVSVECQATIGSVSNPEHRSIRWGKAGRSRHRGKRPSVRGKAMNPVDHPHGGGEGKHPIGLKHPKTYTGKPALGVKTRKSRQWSNAFIINRRRSK